MSTDAMTAWASLRHGGLLVAPARVPEVFPSSLPPLPEFVEEKLRRAISRGGGQHLGTLLDVVLEHMCGLHNSDTTRWFKGSSEVGSKWAHRVLTGEMRSPRRVWDTDSGGRLFVFDDEERLGVGRGRRSVARIVEWLRASGEKLALVTNGQQWRVIHAGADHEAWAEADTSLWFETGHAGSQVDALRMLLSPAMLTPPKKGESSPLLAAIDASRRGQAELSAELGERVRRAVELFIQSMGGPLSTISSSVSSRHIYLAATRIIMRMVVVLFAEARELLPLFNPVYHRAYGLSGLREALERVGSGEGAERLKHRAGAFPRILALFRLVYEGSHHEAVTIARYGGGLFAPGTVNPDDPVHQVLALFENPEFGPSDWIVWQILRLLCRCPVRVRQGRTTTVVDMPVDFKDLSSEYIGILYEGLLDFELRQAAEKDPIVFLALGDEPALPMSRLEAMSDAALSNLVAKLAVKKAQTDDEEEADEEAESEAEQQADAELAVEGSAPAVEVVDDIHLVAKNRALAWAKRAVIAGKRVGKPKGKKADALAQYERDVATMAEGLIRRVFLPGEWFLVRWGGTRKGSGTFYTRPQLAVPTVHRTLRPLAYDAPRKTDGTEDRDAPFEAWTPKKPAEILSLKVCDPAMGSGSFLVASLRFLTDALFASLYHHGCIAAQGRDTMITLPFGMPSAGSLGEYKLPRRPDDEGFEPLLRARLKRFVLERCLYGVDLDPLAVELGRLALWVETMDRDLPFEFLRHKFKEGNSLVGCWFDRFRDYPLLAWMREGGDKQHDQAVHFKKEAWTKKIIDFRNGRVKEEMRAVLAGQAALFAKTLPNADALHAEAAKVFEQLHDVPMESPEEREELYKKAIEDREEIKALREAFDTWCAVWFWPADKLDDAPLPRDFTRLAETTKSIVRDLRNQYRFFHWELDFPDVFARQQRGFDAMVGNPPWEIQKPNSLEFFSNVDPLYRTYTKTEATKRQRELFEARESDERSWLDYNAKLKALGNWVKNVGSPFGDGADGGAVFALGKGTEGLVADWAKARALHGGYADAEHPFRHQGSADVNTYKLFLEQTHALLGKGGALGMLVPSGIYSDLGTKDLRKLFLERCRWDFLYAFQNERFVFGNVHHSFKVAVTGLTKGERTEEIAARFRLGPAQSPEIGELEEDITSADRFARFSIERIKRLSPGQLAIFEVRSTRDANVLDEIVGAGITFLSKRESWGLRFTTELHKTNDAKFLRSRASMEEQHLLSATDDVRDARVRVRLRDGGWTPVWQGANCKFESWHNQPDEFIELSNARPWLWGAFPFGVRRVARNTDERTLIACVVPPLTPTMYTIEICRDLSFRRALFVYGLISSFVLDYVMRFQVSSSIALTLVDGLPLPAESEQRQTFVSICVARLFKEGNAAQRAGRRATLEAVVAFAYGLSVKDFGWILRECDHSPSFLRDTANTRKLDPTGFWRVDKDQDPELRHTVLSQIAFHDLQRTIAEHGGDRDKGIEAFCAQNDGDGWMLPETLRLADYGLGHDDRAKQPQPVASRLGERFLPWQLEQSVEESWAECEQHAKNLLGEEGFAKLMAEINGKSVETNATVPENATAPAPTPALANRPTDLFGNPIPTDLFGNPIEQRGKGKRKR